MEGQARLPDYDLFVLRREKEELAEELKYACFIFFQFVISFTT